MGFRLWLLLAGVTIAAGVIVPYGLLAGSVSLATFVFWCLFGLVVVALIAAGTAGWRG